MLAHRTFAATGFLQAVQFNPTDKNLVFVGSTSKQVLMFDKRQNEPVLTFANDAMVNTMYALALSSTLCCFFVASSRLTHVLTSCSTNAT
jgi:WD40 repeat protein